MCIWYNSNDAFFLNNARSSSMVSSLYITIDFLIVAILKNKYIYKTEMTWSWSVCDAVFSLIFKREKISIHHWMSINKHSKKIHHIHGVAKVAGRYKFLGKKSNIDKNYFSDAKPWSQLSYLIINAGCLTSIHINKIFLNNLNANEYIVTKCLVALLYFM